MTAHPARRLRCYEFEHVVEWASIIEEMRDESGGLS